MKKTTLKDKLDRVFSTYIRLRDSSENGYIRCYCCGKFLPWKESENMHFIPRQHMGTRFDEINCNAGCTHCNYYNNGNIEAYTLHLIRDHGDSIVERLTLKKTIGRKFSDFEFKELINYYNGEIKKLKNKKGL